jgi:hypothetical protein
MKKHEVSPIAAIKHKTLAPRRGLLLSRENRKAATQIGTISTAGVKYLIIVRRLPPKMRSGKPKRTKNRTALLRISRPSAVARLYAYTIATDSSKKTSHLKTRVKSYHCELKSKSTIVAFQKHIQA